MDTNKIREAYEEYSFTKTKIYGGIDYLSSYTVIDDNQTVLWNRQQVKKENSKRKTDYLKEKEKLFLLYDILKNYCVQYITEKTGLQRKVSEKLFNYLIDKEALIPSYGIDNNADSFIASLKDLISCFIM